MPTDELLAEQDLVETVWSGTIHNMMDRLEPERIRALEGAVEALRSLEGALREERAER
ncbi:hypothetical protein H4W79_001402 [Nocardiopsis terrae]|uniref:MarR family transcriptional regulator n=1 Tax=Nocardiopsis terrae TaxID=372655 RepID=A0ABR9HDT6_9ACTN|nr:hypothetical protein [Nocardiopsis terrae]MBE1457188.1 hypothetical protein [Nocardiopsis terrae]